MEIKRGRPPKIGVEHDAVLLDIVNQYAAWTVQEIKVEFERRSGLQVHESTLMKSLLRLGVQRRKGADAVKIEKSRATERRYGYTDRHREQGS